MSGAEIVPLLECEPTLGAGLSESDRRAARGALPAQVVDLEAGAWEPGSNCPDGDRLGYLIASGLLVRRIEVGAGSSVELLGRGDVLRPWQEDSSSFCRASWEALERTSLAILGPNLARELAEWPALLTNLVARGVGRSRAIAADSAIASIVGVEERLLILLWHIAERWGEGRRDGVHVTIRLPHRLLAELVGARRPSVTSALAKLQQEGRLVSAANGCWVLPGDPPC